MDAYFQLLNPLIFGLFAFGFLALNKIQSSRAAQYLALSYCFGALAFVGDIIFPTTTDFVTRLPIAALYALTAVFVSAGFWQYYRGRVPWRFLLSALTIHLTIYGYLIFIESIWPRSIYVNLGCAFLFSIGLWAMATSTKKRPIDRGLFALHVFSCALCIVRPVALFLMFYTALESAAQREEVFILSLHLLAGVLAVGTGVIMLVMFSQDILQQLRRHSEMDVQTDIYNRRGFEGEARRLLKSPDISPLCLILVDIDHFKRVNDTHGHATGDRVIAELGTLIKAFWRRDSICGRIGGEEFGLILGSTPMSEAIGIAETLRSAFEKTVFDAATGKLSCTASFGVAQYKASDDLEALYARADKCLYLSKRTGRNKVSVETDLAVEGLKAALIEATGSNASKALKKSA